MSTRRNDHFKKQCPQQKNSGSGPASGKLFVTVTLPDWKILSAEAFLEFDIKFQWVGEKYLTKLSEKMNHFELNVCTSATVFFFLAYYYPLNARCCFRLTGDL